MQLKIATWNINSVRLRADLVCRFLERWQPDVLCLQETKCPEGLFPAVLFAARGYPHIAERGQAGYHGTTRQFCGKDDARHIAVRLAGDGLPWIHSLYVPAGGDLPDPDLNPKFAHKLAFLDEMRCWLGSGIHDNAPHILAGDFNVAPLEHDVWSHRQLLKVVSHTPLETERLVAIMAGRNWHDVMRAHVPSSDKLYTWWSYRARDWAASDRGRRLDHIWLDARYRDTFQTCTVTPCAAPNLTVPAGNRIPGIAQDSFYGAPGPRLGAHLRPCPGAGDAVAEARPLMPSLAPAEGFRLLEQELHLAQHQHGGIELGRDGLDDARPGFRKLADQLEEEIVADLVHRQRRNCRDGEVMRQLGQHGELAEKGAPLDRRHHFDAVARGGLRRPRHHQIAARAGIAGPVQRLALLQHMPARGKRQDLQMRRVDAGKERHVPQQLDGRFDAHGTSLYPPVSVTRICACDGSASIFCRNR